MGILHLTDGHGNGGGPPYLVVRDGQPNSDRARTDWRHHCTAAGRPEIVVRLTDGYPIVYFDFGMMKPQPGPLARALVGVWEAFDHYALRAPYSGESIVCDHSTGLYGLVPTEGRAHSLAGSLVEIFRDLQSGKVQRT
jgi:hypothetical protein